MAIMEHLLSTLVLLPIIGAILILCMKNDEKGASHARSLALIITTATFLFSLLLWRDFDPTTADFQFVEFGTWFVGININFHFGIDGISLFMVLLTTLLIPICILASFHSITTRVKEFMAAFLILESFVIGVFASLDLVLFYIFFEGVLIPMYLIIGIWGGANRIYASYKFFLYTLLGSVLLLLAVLYLYHALGTTDIPTLIAKAPHIAPAIQKYLWLAMFASFAVKVPMWPVHTWLPDAHVQAPTAGSVILAGILLKMGAYGFLRFSLPMLPDASFYFTPLMFTLSIVAIIYTSLVALMQQDMKKLIAYSSVAHMGFVTLGLFTFNQQGVEGAIIQMISHGLISGALFICVGVVYDRLHTREITRYGGLVNIMPNYAAVFLFFILASVGLPGTSGFIGEFLVLVGVFQADKMVAALAATALILGAAYALWLYRRVVMGEVARVELSKMVDLNRTEKWMVVPLILLTLWLGIYPKPYLDAMHSSVAHLITQTKMGMVYKGHEPVPVAKPVSKRVDLPSNEKNEEVLPSPDAAERQTDTHMQKGHMVKETHTTDNPEWKPPVRDTPNRKLRRRAIPHEVEQEISEEDFSW